MYQHTHTVYIWMIHFNDGKYLERSTMVVSQKAWCSKNEANVIKTIFSDTIRCLLKVRCNPSSLSLSFFIYLFFAFFINSMSSSWMTFSSSFLGFHRFSFFIQTVRLLLNKLWYVFSDRKNALLSLLKYNSLTLPVFVLALYPSFLVRRCSFYTPE